MTFTQRGNDPNVRTKIPKRGDFINDVHSVGEGVSKDTLNFADREGG